MGDTVEVMQKQGRKRVWTVRRRARHARCAAPRCTRRHTRAELSLLEVLPPRLSQRAKPLESSPFPRSVKPYKPHFLPQNVYASTLKCSLIALVGSVQVQAALRNRVLEQWETVLADEPQISPESGSSPCHLFMLCLCAAGDRDSPLSRRCLRGHFRPGES
eukprot:6182594-Pleurochrysis_carterae.AAC.2